MKVVIDNPNRGIINGVDYTDTKYHPRMIELNIITTYMNFVREYGVIKTEELFKAFSNLFGVDVSKILGIVRNADRVMVQSKTDKMRYRQEILFMGAVWGHHRLYTAKQHLHITHATLYRYGAELNPEKFVNQDWLDQLANNVIICGIDGYKQEGIRFVDGFFNLVKIIGNVSISKIRI
jgi:hypothetical protein